MPRKRSEFTELMFDENFKYVPKSKWHEVKGDLYVRVHIHADKSENQKKYNNSRKLTLPYDCDPSKPPILLKHYTRTKSGRPRTRSSEEPEVLRDIQNFKEKMAYVKSVALDETQTVVKKSKKI